MLSSADVMELPNKQKTTKYAETLCLKDAGFDPKAKYPAVLGESSVVFFFLYACGGLIPYK